MKISFLKQLCCPSINDGFAVPKMCKGSLSLSGQFTEVIYGHSEDELLQGLLRCESCGALYPVVAGVAIIVPDLRRYLQDNFASIMQELNPLVKESGCITPKMIRVLSSLRDGDSSEWNQDECLDVYLQAHFSNIEKGDSPLDTAVADYTGYNFYNQQFRHISRILGGGKFYNKGNALDLGCSVGGMAWRMASSFNSVIGIDMSFSAILKARQVLIHEPFRLSSVSCETEPGIFDQSVELDQLYSENTEFLAASAMAIPFPDKWADCVTSINLIDVLPDPALHIAEAARILHMDGLLYLCDPLCWTQEIIMEIIKKYGSSVSYLEMIFHNAGMVVFDSYDAPWALRINDRQANLYLCHCLAAKKQRNIV